jgi:hypothetical protein
MLHSEAEIRKHFHLNDKVEMEKYLSMVGDNVEHSSKNWKFGRLYIRIGRYPGLSLSAAYGKFSVDFHKDK